MGSYRLGSGLAAHFEPNILSLPAVCFKTITPLKRLRGLARIYGHDATNFLYKLENEIQFRSERVP